MPFTRVVIDCITNDFVYLLRGLEAGAVDWLSAHAGEEYDTIGVQFPDRIAFDAADWELFTVRCFFPAIGLCLRGNYCYISMKCEQVASCQKIYITYALLCFMVLIV